MDKGIIVGNNCKGIIENRLYKVQIWFLFIRWSTRYESMISKLDDTTQNIKCKWTLEKQKKQRYETISHCKNKNNVGRYN